MTFEIILDVAIGLSLLFFLTSIIASSINEIFAAIFNSRGRHLERAIYDLLDGAQTGRRPRTTDAFSRRPAIDLPNRIQAGSIGDEFFSDPLIKTFSSNGRLPSFIDDDIAGEAIRRVIAKNVSASGSAPSNGTPEKGILSATAYTPEILNRNGQAVAERLYRHHMDRMSGWYKRRTQISLFFIGLLLAISLDLNAIEVTARLAKDANLRERVAASATAYEASQNTGRTDENAKQRFDNAFEELEKLCLPIGHGFLCKSDAAESEKKKKVIEENCEAPSGEKFRPEIDAGEPEGIKPTCDEVNEIVDPENCDENCRRKKAYKDEKVTSELLAPLGWFFAAVAAALGAPFWFEMLGKFVNLRSTGPKDGGLREPPKEPTDGGRGDEPGKRFDQDDESQPTRPETLTSYEERLTDDDWTDVALLLGFDNPGGKQILLNPAFRLSVKAKKARMGLPINEELDERFVTRLFKQ